MALVSYSVELLIRLKQEGYIRDRAAVIEMGAQQLHHDFLASHARLKTLGELFGATNPFPLAGPSEVAPGERISQPLQADAPLARTFWQWLGCDYASVDIDGSPGSIPLDLNFDAVPAQAIGRYDLVTNFGTTEHVANQVNAFTIVHDLTSMGGVMIHVVPAQGEINHGLVNYNPKFFWMLARSNGYKWLYADYCWSGIPYSLPSNIVDEVKIFRPDISERSHDHTLSDAGFIVALQKVYAIPFVPPIDVGTGSTTTHKAVEERYWTVFSPGAFERLPRWPDPAAKSQDVNADPGANAYGIVNNTGTGETGPSS